ncbi:heavy metal translocating P-type ATPase [Nostoc ellipsosporum NOK]|nr:heavy metal translocating P-type ATPase [Nostoc ellipsosporum NOK]
MKKIQLDIDLLLPDVPDEKDECVRRILEELKTEPGLEKVHVVPSTASAPARLCLHIDTSVTSIKEVEQIAKEAGARITERYRHLLVEVQGVRHQRQTHLIETRLKKEKGILGASVAGTGNILIEYDTTLVNEEEVMTFLKKEQLRVVQPSTAKEPAHDHDHAHDEEDHHHGGVLGSNSELYFSLLCGLFTGVAWALEKWTGTDPVILLTLFGLAYLLGGFYTAKEAVQTIAKGGFEIDFLMLVAAAGAAILGNWFEGALLLFLFSLGHALEHFALEKARKSIASLADLRPKTALLLVNGTTKEVPVDELRAGDIILVKPHSKIAADGVIVKGSSSVNQAPITGESVPVDKTATDSTATDGGKAADMHRVFAGTINGDGSLEIKVSNIAADSTLSRLIKMVNEAQTQKSPTQQFTDKFEKFFVPAVLLLVTSLCFAFLVIDEPFRESFYRAMSVLVAASPCALAISTPSAVLSGIARAARAGVLIKGGRPLEDLGTLQAMAFDKTGTLTEGKPKLTLVQTLSTTVSEQDLLQLAVAIEAGSDHPLAQAVVKGGKEKLNEAVIKPAENVQAIQGKGIQATINGHTITAGNLALFEKDSPPSNITEAVQQAEKEGNTIILIRKNDVYIGLLGLMDTPREEAKDSISRLREEGIRTIIMLSGDNQHVADAVAAQTGIDEARGGLLPEQKVQAMEELVSREKKVAMIGDGVNDAPAMARSTVGIAMGAAGSDVALETADVALMGDRLSLLPFAVGLSRQSRRIIRQNLAISLGMVALLVPLTIAGVATIGPAVMAHEGSTLVVVMNALRLLAFRQGNKKVTA